MSEPRDLTPEDTKRTWRLGQEPRDAVPPVEDAVPPAYAPPADERPEPGADYSATVLAEHWAPAAAAPTLREPVPAAPARPATRSEPSLTLPDRVDGEVMRFGPGVTPAAAARAASVAAEVWHGTLRPPAVPGTQAASRRRGPRRYVLAGAVLLAVLAYLAWQRFGPVLAVREVTVAAVPSAPSCDTRVDVIATVRTNGRAGTLTYRWLRNDGTSSGPLYEKVPGGRDTTRLHLLWTFHGHGSYDARAELRVSAPGSRSAVTAFTYTCA
ncbi:hypothetical protein ACIP98_05695 [Streptomyces sp. NPDC088354]|uniref:hypothetical protein n=1 Tax=unclassified Streptomyces TaxID=2593676 RepID=UPI0029BA0314|nr:hypothetical protein [Streptomyces sp. MI02-7b]MDX3073769.1 hypothetical protein [Streptomyces sp. MI02-7b]